MISKDQFWKIAGVTQHIQFENFLRKIVFDPEKRNNFFKQLLKLDAQCVVQDTFKQYFEEYAAERKANQQDYTPDEVSKLYPSLLTQNTMLISRMIWKSDTFTRKAILLQILLQVLAHY
ncbi:hypothetical protein [Lactobacillus jensenii]|uniref:Uncharacterized protein n=1 Tax=Lactobacillus jensenii TaxID=109790 RepID=A0ABU9FIB4_LACJE|nr:hypothetical protein [Lactobacillus jensenii]MDT9545391.1 hypothetical protein [Lactobacillus jensenii]